MRSISEEVKYLVGISFFEGIGPHRYRLLKKHFGSARAVYLAHAADLIAAGLSATLVEKIRLFRRRFNLEKFLQQMAKSGIEVIAADSPLYPRELKPLRGMPMVLYGLGNVSLLADAWKFAVVGTRKPSDYGQRITRQIVAVLSQSGLTIVSGMAMGIDGIAQQTALEKKGRTIAVLGCGVDICYPAVNRGLYQQLIKNGLIISEFPPGKTVALGVFPARNRIIAGLSRGTLVVEGSLKSGTLITAKYALEYGKEVFAVPGRLQEEMAEAPNFLIREGARIVTSAEDILRDYQLTAVATAKVDPQKLNLNKPEQAVFRLIFEEPGIQVDELIRRLKLKPEKALIILSELEMRQILKSDSAGHYSIM